MLSSGLRKRGPQNQRRRQVAQAFAWAEQRTMSVSMGVLHDDDDDQAGNDPSASYHVDRGDRGQEGEARQTSQGVREVKRELRRTFP